jgi:hypothetical protein
VRERERERKRERERERDDQAVGRKKKAGNKRLGCDQVVEHLLSTHRL